MPRHPETRRRLALIGTLLSLGFPALASADPPWLTVDLDVVGSSGGLLRRVHGSTGTGDFGVPVASGGDVDGDRTPDHAFSSMRASPLGRTEAGEIYLVFGDGTLEGALDTAVTQAGVLKIAGEGVQEAAGSEVWIDDVTGDGIADLLIGRQNHQPDPTRPGAGALSILVGGPALRTHAATLAYLDLGALPPGVTSTKLVGAEALGRLGIWMRTGDVTGDGIADLVVGADQEDGSGEPDRGALYLIRGGPHLAAAQTIDLASLGSTALAGHVAKLVPPSPATEFHFGATCQIADLDANGRGEVLAAATINRAGAALLADGAPPGSAHAVAGSADGTLFIAWDDNFGGTSWPSQDTIDLGAPPGRRTIIDGGDPNVSFGEEILGGLDYDADGREDLFVGDLAADYSPARTRPLSGSGHVLYDAARLKGRVFDLDAPPPKLATTLVLGGDANSLAADTALQGDFDGDGRDDLALSSPHAAPLGRDDAGALHVLFGQRGRWPPRIELAEDALPRPSAIRVTEVLGALGTRGSDHGDTLAYSGDAADVDGDGRDDLIINEMRGNGARPELEDVGNLLALSGTLVSAPTSPCSPTPATGCRVSLSRGTRLEVRDLARGLRDRLFWKVEHDGTDTLGDFATPTASGAGYGLCIYDASGPAQPVLRATVAGGSTCGAKPCWEQRGTAGFRYENQRSIPDGIVRIELRAGTSGKSSVLVKGRGASLPTPALPLTLPVTVQLSIASSAATECWQASYAEAKRNSRHRFVAAGP